VSALDVEIQCQGIGEVDIKYSLLTLYEKQPINIGRQTQEVCII